jgi:hypothetical protein
MEELVFTIEFNTHVIRVRRSNATYHCWKYTDNWFYYENYDNEELAMDYITSAPPSINWEMVYN